MIIGAMEYNTNGSVIVRSLVNELAPSMVAASYRSSGIACSTPVVIANTNGNPNQVCIMIKAVLVQKGSVIHAFGSMPSIGRIELLITPKLSLNIPANTKMVTKPGTAQGKMKMVLTIPLKRRSFWFTKIASNTPTEHCKVVASTVHTTVHCNTSKKVLRHNFKEKMFSKILKPTQ